MKILFIYTNINGFHEDTYSFGLASIVSITRACGHEVKVVILKQRNEYQLIEDVLRCFQPQILGFSAVSSQFRFVKELCALAKKIQPDILTVCGGVHPTINLNCLHETPHLDCIFIGEAEQSFEEFLHKVELKENYYNVPNLAYLNDGKIISNPLMPLLMDLNSLPFPDKEVYPYADTISISGYAPFFFTRGCPFLCAYCSNHAIARLYGKSRNMPRYRAPELCIREIEETIQRFPMIKNIYIGDDIFGLDKRWRKEFCEKYQQRVGIKYSCLLRVNVIDEEFLDLLKRSGCYRILIGLESGNDYVRNQIMERNLSNDQIERAFSLVHRFSFQTVSLNIIGVPGETEAMILDTIKLNRRIHPTISGVNIFYPYKGTKLGDYCFENNLVDQNRYDDFSNERRESVLKYPAEFKNKLIYYRGHWDALVYPHDIWRMIMRPLRSSPLWSKLHFAKRQVNKFVEHKMFRR